MANPPEFPKGASILLNDSSGESSSERNHSLQTPRVPSEATGCCNSNLAVPEKTGILSKFHARVIMNPVVLSIFSHFPNKCIHKKSEKYVVTGVSILGVPADKESNSKTSSHNVNPNTKHALPQQAGAAGKSSKNKPSSKFRRYAGLLLAILSSMMFSFTGLIVKVINHHHPLTQAAWMFVGTAVVALPLNLLKCVYNYHANRLDRMKDQEKDVKKPEQFKSLPDNIEPVLKITIKSEENCSFQQEKCKNTDKALDSDTNPSLPKLANKTALRQQQERRRKFKLFMLLLVRACSGCSGMILYFYSLKYLNVGDSLVIVCSSPIFVFIIGYLFLGEQCGVVPVITILLTMTGVLVITRPPLLTGKEAFETDDMIGAALAFSSMLCIAMTIILMRFLQNVYHGLINLVFGIWGTLQTTVLALAVGVLDCPRDMHDAVLMSATGVLFFLGQTFLAVALQFEEAGPVSLVRTSEVVFAFIWQFIFLQVSPDIFSISGAGLIMVGILLTISRKWIASLPENSSSRKIFSFLLR